MISLWITGIIKIGETIKCTIIPDGHGEEIANVKTMNGISLMI
jgi:hypothetical protein